MKSKFEKGSLGYFNEKAKEKGFVNWSEYYKWMKDNNKLPKITYTNEEWCKERGFNNQKEYRDYYAQKRGFIDDTERRKINDYDRGISSPMEDNEECTRYFGEFITENYVRILFENVTIMPINNPGYDWIWKDYKIDHKSSCLINNNGYLQYIFSIEFNDKTDYFVLSGWENRCSLRPTHVWLIHKNETIRNNCFWTRKNFSITNNPRRLKEFEKYEITNKVIKQI